MAHPDKPDPTPFSVNVSASPCEEADALGFDEHVINRFILRMAEFFIFKNTRFVLGHDWREDGVMRSIADFAQAAATEGDLGDPKFKERLLNIVPCGKKPVAGIARDAMDLAGGVLTAISAADAANDDRYKPDGELPKGWLDQKPTEFWGLRVILSDLLGPGPAAVDHRSGIRICLGGKTRGYGGYYSGIAEEAYFALAREKPLYLLPAFGGATKAVYDALQGKNCDHDTLCPPASDPKEIDEIVRIGNELGIPLGRPKSKSTTETGQNLGRWFKEKCGIDRYWELNDLVDEERTTLETTTDLETALALIASKQGLSPME